MATFLPSFLFWETQEIKKNTCDYGDSVELLCREINKIEGGSQLIVIGGTALRLLEAIVNGSSSQNVNILSGADIDVMYPGVDEEQRQKLSKTLNSLSLKKRVDVQRFRTFEESQSTIFPQTVLKGRNLSISAIFGRVQVPFCQEKYECIDISTNSGDIRVAAPSLLYHFYATRSLGDGKRKDWDRNKFNRVRRLVQRMRVMYDIPFLSPNELNEWRELRSKLKESKLAQTLHFAVDLHDFIGRPLERMGFANKIL
jgi:hypothetical protein